MNRNALEFNGSSFENVIARYLIHRYPNCEILTNVQLYSEYLQKSTQIDLIMITIHGVFVIEAKNWRRWIKGTYNDSHWLGLSSGSNTIRTFSPVNQNMIHIRTLRNALRTKLGVNPVDFINIVCLPDGTTLNTNCSEVCNLSYLGLLIDKYLMTRLYTIDPVVVKEMILKVVD